MAVFLLLTVSSLILLALVVACIFRKASVKEAFDESQPKDKLLFFYATWCPHCTDFHPKVLAYKEMGEIDVELLEDKTTDSSLKSTYSIQGYPTIYYVNEDTNTKTRFNAARTTESLQSFVASCRNGKQ